MRTIFSVLKASEGGQSFRDAKMALEFAGVVDIKRCESCYIGHYGISVPEKFAKRATRVLFGGGR